MDQDQFLGLHAQSMEHNISNVTDPVVQRRLRERVNASRVLVLDKDNEELDHVPANRQELFSTCGPNVRGIVGQNPDRLFLFGPPFEDGRSTKDVRWGRGERVDNYIMLQISFRAFRSIISKHW